MVPHWAQFFDQCELRDVLDSVTIAYQVLVTVSALWLAETGTEVCFS
jgi:hypothetical protein